MIQIQSQSDSSFKAINLACGGKLCNQLGWINADHSPSTKEVMQVNLLKPLPFENNTFDIVYHAQFIEHLPMDLANTFLKECYRVLKPNGVLRVVTPDLKDQASEYLKTLQNVLDNPNDGDAKLQYDWIRLEMLDQLTRQKAGGDMVDFLSRSGKNAQNYIQRRLGRSGEWMIPSPSKLQSSSQRQSLKQVLRKIRDSFKLVIRKLTPEAFLVGNFRMSGEVHLCMYDEHLLTSVLSGCGFCNIKQVTAKSSQIEAWGETLLDADSDGNPDCPASLFMEAIKLPQGSLSQDKDC